MPEIIFHQPWMLLLLLLLPVAVVMFRLRAIKQRKDMAQFGVALQGRKSEHLSMESWRLLLLVLAVLMLIVALIRPAINPHPKMIQREGRDVVFLLDVSKSMLAEDRLPNRLQSAKISIAECVQSLDDHRVGLVVFAGSSSIVCPLTMDTKFFLNSLEKAGPDSVAHGGTRIGDALLKVCDKLFSDRDQGYKDIVLLSDGGDQSEGMTAAIKQLNDKQVRLIAIGVGDPQQGARIPSQDGKGDFMLYQKQEVWSRLDGALLSELVQNLDQGAYLPVGTRQMHLDAIYNRLSQQGGTQQLAEESVITYDEIFQIFIGLALLFLLTMAVVPHTLHRTISSAFSKSSSSFTAVIAIGVLLIPSELKAEESAYGHYLKGNEAYRAHDYELAVQCYESALQHQPSSARIRDITYNLGNAYLKSSDTADNHYTALSQVNQSIIMYRCVLSQYKGDRDAAVNHELARIERRKLQKTIAEEEEHRKQLQTALNEIRERLLVLIVMQQRNLPQADEPEDIAPDQWLDKEQKVADGTNQVSTLVNKLNEKFFKGFPGDLTPVGETKKHLATAFLNENEALLIFINQWPEALVKGRTALQSLRDALAALPQDAEGSSQDSDQGDEGEESESSEEGEEGEGKDGENDSQGGEEGEMDSAQSTKIDLESIDLPPPSNSPEDVIRMGQEMQEARQAAGARKKGKPVEKDW